MFPQTIKIRVSWHCHFRLNSQKKSSMSGNPLFMGIFSQLFFNPWHQYYRLNVEREHHLNVWYVFFVFCFRGNRSILDLMGTICSRKQVNNFCPFAGMSQHIVWILPSPLFAYWFWYKCTHEWSARQKCILSYFHNNIYFDK